MKLENNTVITELSGLPIALLHRYTLYGKCPVFQHIFFATCGVLICLWNYGNYFSSENDIYIKKNIREKDYYFLNFLNTFSCFVLYLLLYFNYVRLFLRGNELKY